MVDIVFVAVGGSAFRNHLPGGKCVQVFVPYLELKAPNMLS